MTLNTIRTDDPHRRTSRYFQLSPWELFVGDFLPNQVIVELQLAEFRPGETEQCVRRANENVTTHLQSLSDEPVHQAMKMILQRFLQLTTLMEKYEFACAIKALDSADEAKSHLLSEVAQAVRNSAEGVLTELH